MSYHWHDDEYGWCSCDEPTCEQCKDTGSVECWNPGGLCPVQNEPGCDTCGPCSLCSAAAVSGVAGNPDE